MIQDHTYHHDTTVQQQHQCTCGAYESEHGTHSQFDYENQAWLVNGKYIACGHPKPCTTCYGTAHEGQPPATNVNLH